jgi:hypothetical protein
LGIFTLSASEKNFTLSASGKKIKKYLYIVNILGHPLLGIFTLSASEKIQVNYIRIKSIFSVRAAAAMPAMRN